MVEIGSVISAKVTRIEPYGVYLEHDGETVLVLAPEVSWTDKRNLREQVQIGQTIDVLVLHHPYGKKEIVGSIRRLHQEENPYRSLSHLEAGTILQGKVAGIYGDDAIVQFPNGARGTIPNCESQQKELERGTEVNVTIAALDVDEGRLTLRLADQEHEHTSTPASTTCIETPR